MYSNLGSTNFNEYNFRNLNLTDCGVLLRGELFAGPGHFYTRLKSILRPAGCVTIVSFTAELVYYYVRLSL